ncbi:site-specific DNA-methyltransferase [Deltaproteobacteria bacterium Smac51]|nr:site-specific DNA-methyltransferase [Deltaproteobacteria bacterium Smac51]
MTTHKQKLELTWIGKEKRPRLEPRILLEDTALSHHAPFRRSDNDIYDNKLIHGDNLLALKALEQDYTGRVKCVFIDPPYNTGSAFEHYDDGLEHSIWLGLMRDRLEILKRLLSDDGSIWITIDDNEAHYLKVLCDEVFGRNNFLTNFIWQKSYGGGSKARWYVGLHEHILCYAKDMTKLPDFWLPPDPEAARKYYKYKDNKYNERGPYRLQPLATTSMDDRPNLRYPIVLPDGSNIWPEKQWQWSKNRVETALANDELVFTRNDEKVTVSYKQYLRDKDGVERGRKPVSIISGNYTQHGTNESVALFGLKNKFSFPKPEGLINTILECGTNPGDLVLDSFAGSGTTGAVAQKMGRRWIIIELGEHAHTHIVPRLKKVIDGEDQGGITKAVGWTGGGGFRYYKLAPSLLEKDKWGRWVISKKYNGTMLSEAVCKFMGFHYEPSDSVWWIHGRANENAYIYVTTQSIDQVTMEALSEEVGLERSLLICCGAFLGKADRFKNLTVTKIPRAVMSKCEWGQDDYSLNIQNLPMLKPEPEAPAKKVIKSEPSLFDDIGE